MTKSEIGLAIVMPVYEDRESVACLLRDLNAHLDRPFHVFAIEDGSIRNPLRLEDMTGAGVAGEILHLRRNMGHQRAIAAGLCHVNATCEPEMLVVMDSDGEDRADSIIELVAALEEPGVEAAVAVRRSRQDSMGFKLFYGWYKFVFRMLTGHWVSFGNFMALRPAGLSRLTAMTETWLHLAGSLILSKLPVRKVPLDRGKRYRGQSKMNFSGLVLHGMRAVMVFAEDVLVRVGVACAGLVVASTLGVLVILAMKLSGITSPGWATTAAGVMMLVGLQAGILVLLLLLINGTARSRAPLPDDAVERLFDR
ncbi:MAG: glycosyltransferase, partial [Pseudomonadota bacterium]|nr:glycosyltransferase [Pseudomonadota bacterium]